MKLRILIPALYVFLLSCCGTLNCHAQVRAWEGTMTIPTYPWGPDSLNPRFFAVEDSIIYPYNMQDNLSATKVDRTYKALFLENEYLRVTCLPELGGRIHSVFDKSTDKEMFHTNPVIKPGLIAMRGAWISGGIEWNTGPHGHTVTAVSPVDATLVGNPDGSASLIVNNIEKIFRTRWTVKLTLHPGRAYLDEEIRITNPVDALNPYYFWNCTAFYNTDDTRFIYPMTLGTNHSGNQFFTWPMFRGKDITYLKNYDQPTSIFAYDCDFDFFGAYDSGLDQGIVSTANHYQLIGKKAWTWGKSDNGIVSQKNLHDFGEQYIEVQSGPLLTQADYGLLDPHQSVAWHEYWYPVHGLGDGFEFANKDVAVQTIRHEDALELRIIATSEFPDARVRVSDGKSSGTTLRVELSPSQPAVVRVEHLPDGPSRIEVLNGSGNDSLAVFTSPLPIPVVKEPELPWWMTKESDFTIDELYYKALLFDKQTNRPAARDWYGKVLALDPLHADANRQLGILDLEAGLYDSAAVHFDTTLTRNPDDAMAWYYRGVAALKAEDFDKAEECGYKVVKYRPESSLGYDLVGRAVYPWDCLQSDFHRSIGLFKKALQQNPDDTTARNHQLMTALRSDSTDYIRKASELLPVCPDSTDLFFRAIQAIAKSDMSGFTKYLESSVGEVEFELIETANAFMEFKLYDAAYQVINTIKAPAFEYKRTSLSYYYLAWLAANSGKLETVAGYLRQAASMTADYVFPSRVETIPVLEFAIANSPDDAKAHLLLGNLLGGLGRLDEAREHFTLAVAVDPALSTAQRNLGYIAWHSDHDLVVAADYYRKAIDHRPDDQVLYRDLARILLQANKRDEAIALMENMPVQSHRTDIVEILAQAYVDEKHYTQALGLLNDSFFSNWEDRTVSHNVYVRAHLERGKISLEKGDNAAALQDFQDALLYPENLGVGRPANPPQAEAYFWIGTALKAMDRLDEARSAWQRGANSRGRGRGQQREYVDKCRQALGM